MAFILLPQLNGRERISHSDVQLLPDQGLKSSHAFYSVPRPLRIFLQDFKRVSYFRGEYSIQESDCSVLVVDCWGFGVGFE